MFTEILTSTAFATLFFQSVSGTAEQVSNQKNLIVQAIRATFPKPSAFIEETADASFTHEESLEHSRLELKCVACHPFPDGQALILESVHVASDITRKNTMNLTFETAISNVTATETLSTFSWKISLETKPLSFALFSNADISSNESVSKAMARVAPCLATLRCDTRATFSTAQLANAARDKIDQMVAKRRVAEGRQISLNDFETRALVLRGDTVKLTNRSIPGITIRALATALRTGKPNEIIPVTIVRKKNQDSGTLARGETVNARVTGSGEVEYVE